MNYGQQKAYKGNRLTAYITRLKPWYKGDPDRYIVTYYAKAGNGKSSGLKEFKSELDAQEFIHGLLIYN